MKTAWLAVSVALLMVYGVLGYCILNPKVSPPYRDYYISHSSRLSPRLLEAQRSRLKSIEPNKANFAMDGGALSFESGWSYPETGHRWSSADVAKLAFIWTPEVKGLSGKLLLEGAALSGQRVTVLLNNQKLYQGEIPSPEFHLEITYNEKSLKAGINEIIFHLPDARTPGNGDKRTLSLDFKQLKFL